MGFRKISIRAQRGFRALLRLVESIGAGERQRVIVEMRRRAGTQANRSFEVVHCFGDFALFGENPAGQIPGIVIVGVDAKSVAQGSLGAIAVARPSARISASFRDFSGKLGSSAMAF